MIIYCRISSSYNITGSPLCSIDRGTTYKQHRNPAHVRILSTYQLSASKLLCPDIIGDVFVNLLDYIWQISQSHDYIGPKQTLYV